VPHGTLPGSTQRLLTQTLGAWQHLPPQMGVSSGQQFQPSKQRWPVGQTPVPQRVLPACANVTPGTAAAGCQHGHRGAGACKVTRLPGSALAKHH
jgi:hypothetical protein